MHDLLRLFLAYKMRPEMASGLCAIGSCAKPESEGWRPETFFAAACIVAGTEVSVGAKRDEKAQLINPSRQINPRQQAVRFP
jgi:hypothetical protein